DAALDEVARQIPVAAARTLVGLAGSVTTVAALVLGLDAYQPEKIHHSRVSAEAVRAVTVSLLAQTRAERSRLAVEQPGRGDGIAPGRGGGEGGGGVGANTGEGGVGVRGGAGEGAGHPGRLGLVAGTGRGRVTEPPPVPPGGGWPGDPATKATPVAASAAQ